MKINLLLGDAGNIRSGYLNLDATITEKVDERIPCSVDDFGGVACPNEATEIVALGVLDRLPAPVVANSLRYWTSLLAHQGLLTISALDIEEFSLHLSNTDMGLEEVNQVVYTRRSAHTMQGLCQALEYFGLTIQRKWWDGLQACVSAIRP